MSASPQAMTNALGGSSSSPDWSSILGGLGSLAGIGLGVSNQQNAYSGLQNALNTIGPTALNPYSLSGPGGMSTGYNSTGGGSLNLGNLNPGYNGLASILNSGVSGYNSGLLPSLTSTAQSTLPSALSNLTGAYGNYNAAMGAANTQLGSLNDTYNQTYNNTLSGLEASQTPQMQQKAFGLQNTLFGNGTLNSTGATSGAIAAGNFGSQVNAQLGQDQLTAQQMALGAQSAAAQNYSTLSSSAGSILNNALGNYANTNSLISGLNTAGLTNSLSAAQGAGALNTTALNNYNAALQTGSAQAQARNMSLFPYASTASALAGTQNGTGLLANLLTGAGSSLSGQNSGINSLISGGKSLYNWLSGSSSAGLGTIPSGLESTSDIMAGASGDLADAGDLGLGIDLSDFGDAAGAASGALGSGAAGSLASGGLADVSGSLAANGSAIAGLDLSGSGAAGTALGGAAGDGASSLGALGGAAAALAPVGIMAGLIATHPTVSLGAGYWNTLGNQLNTQIDPHASATNNNYGQQVGNTGLSDGQWNAINEVANSIAGSGGTGLMDAGGGDVVPPQIMQQIQNDPKLWAALQGAIQMQRTSAASQSSIIGTNYLKKS